MSKYAPIALFVYARPDHTRRTIEALARNRLAGESELIVFSDAPRRPDIAPSVETVRSFVRTVDGFKTVRIVERKSNLGLALSIIGGVSNVCDTHGRVIVLEDDLVTSSTFLSYMNDALDMYADASRVAAVSAYHPPFEAQLPETFFQRDAECWGWATWKRAWAKFNPDGEKLLSDLRRLGLLRLFDQDDTYPYARMLEDQIAGRNDSWAVRWRATVILNDMLSLYPRYSLTQNIGLDGSGTHGGILNALSEKVSDLPVCVKPMPLEHSEVAFQEFVRFNKRSLNNGFRRRLARKLRGLAAGIGAASD
jgi:hypothetical protein